MKKIIKRNPPEFFSKYIAHNKPKNWEDMTAIRTELRKYILEEQGYCCAYTEIRLDCPDNTHIDHFKRQHLFPDLKFDYTNMLVSCNSEQYGGKYKDKQVSDKKMYADLINPVEESSTDHFEFTYTGKILPLNDSTKGKQTISYFNLNNKELVERRKVVAFCINNMVNDLTEEEIVQAIGEFETMTRQLYKDSH